MAEIYPLRASGEMAGMRCEVKKPSICMRYARFALVPIGEMSKRHTACGHHIGVVVKGIMALSNRPVLVQEIPGNWGNSDAVIDGEIVTLRPGNGG